MSTTKIWRSEANSTRTSKHKWSASRLNCSAPKLTLITLVRCASTNDSVLRSLKKATNMSLATSLTSWLKRWCQELWKQGQRVSSLERIRSRRMNRMRKWRQLERSCMLITTIKKELKPEKTLWFNWLKRKNQIRVKSWIRYCTLITRTKKRKKIRKHHCWVRQLKSRRRSRKSWQSDD